MSTATASTQADEATSEHDPETADAVTAALAARPRRVGVRAEWALVRFALDATMLGLGVAVAESGWRSAGFPPTT